MIKQTQDHQLLMESNRYQVRLRERRRDGSQQRMQTHGLRDDLSEQGTSTLPYPYFRGSNPVLSDPRSYANKLGDHLD